MEIINLIIALASSYWPAILAAGTALLSGFAYLKGRQHSNQKNKKAKEKADKKTIERIDNAHVSDNVSDARNELRKLGK